MSKEIFEEDVDYDPYHEYDMRMLRNEQLRADISPEEAEEELQWGEEE